MSTLIFQIQLKQWEKSQRSPADVAVRAAMSDRFTITAKPEFFILNKPAIIDRCEGALDGHQGSGRALKTAIMKDGSVRLERFIVSERDGKIILSYALENQAPLEVGCLNNGWVQAKYQWRYRVEKDEQIYWQYEEVTLNAVCVEEVEVDLFLTTAPQLTFSSDE